MKREINLEERRTLQLEMLQEIEDFCSSRSIRYSLAYGTLIGAIRHKGFIPWDDDVDIMMPLPDMMKLKKELHSNKIKYCDIETEKHFCYGFSRIAHRDTYSDQGIAFKSYGVNIDLYPIFNVPDTIEERDAYFEVGRKILDKRLGYIKWRNLIIKYLPVSTIPGFDKAMRQYRDYMMNNGFAYGTTNHYFVFGGELSKKERELCTYNFDVFEKLTKVEFEGLTLSAIAKYHEYLTYYYGDYMELPPEDKRIPYHGGRYYWK